MNPPRQIVKSEHGDWELAVARHMNAETFTFDVSGPQGVFCNNMRRADLEEHIRRCQEALAVVPDGR